MRRFSSLIIGAVLTLVIFAGGLAIGAGALGALPFTQEASAVGHWDYFAYSDKTEFNDALTSIPSNCDVQFDVEFAGADAIFAAIYNCAI